ncbi:hypothetical protein Ntsu_48880 [Nocardia sp. IFM 10818]
MDLAAAADITGAASLIFWDNSSYPADWRGGPYIPFDMLPPPVGIVVLMAVCDHEIRNGGFEQFLYNHPSELFYLPGTLRFFGRPELASACLSAAHHAHTTALLPAWGGDRPVLTGPREVFDAYFATEQAALDEHAEPVPLRQVDTMYYRAADDLAKTIGEFIIQRIDDYAQS